MKNLFEKNEELFCKWAEEFVESFPDERDQLNYNVNWFFEKAASEGYCVRYNDAPFDFWDLVCNLRK